MIFFEIELSMASLPIARKKKKPDLRLKSRGRQIQLGSDEELQLKFPNYHDDDDGMNGSKESILLPLAPTCSPFEENGR